MLLRRGRWSLFPAWWCGSGWSPLPASSSRPIRCLRDHPKVNPDWHTPRPGKDRSRWDRQWSEPGPGSGSGMGSAGSGHSGNRRAEPQRRQSGKQQQRINRDTGR